MTSADANLRLTKGDSELKFKSTFVSFSTKLEDEICLLFLPATILHVIWGRAGGTVGFKGHFFRGESVKFNCKRNSEVVSLQNVQQILNDAYFQRVLLLLNYPKTDLAALLVKLIFKSLKNCVKCECICKRKSRQKKTPEIRTSQYAFSNRITTV